MICYASGYHGFLYYSVGYEIFVLRCVFNTDEVNLFRPVVLNIETFILSLCLNCIVNLSIEKDF